MLCPKGLHRNREFHSGVAVYIRKYIVVELNDILSMVEQIQSIDTTGVEPMPHPFGGAQRLREDEVTEHNRREENMQNAPDVMDGLFLVPKVIE